MARVTDSAKNLVRYPIVNGNAEFMSPAMPSAIVYQPPVGCRRNHAEQSLVATTGEE